MKNKLSRRRILRSSIAASAGLLVSPISASTISKMSDDYPFTLRGSYGSIAKHGNLKNDEFMLWSLINVRDQRSLEKQISELRVQHKYRTKIKYSSNDRYKTEICRALIDLVKSSKSLTFDMVYFENYSHEVDLPPKELQQKQSNIYRHFSKSGLQHSYIKAEDGFGPSVEFVSSANQVSGLTIETQRVYEDDVLQFNEFISGCVYAIIKPNHEVVSKHKFQLINYFKEVFGIRDEFNAGSIGENIIVRKEKL